MKIKDIIVLLERGEIELESEVTVLDKDGYTRTIQGFKETMSYNKISPEKELLIKIL